jgi:hypothetical protein
MGDRLDTHIMSVKELEQFVIDKSKNRKNVNLTATLANMLLNHDFTNVIERHEYNEYVRKYEKLFNRNNHSIKKSKHKLLFTVLRDCVITNDIKYPITKLNNILDCMFYTPKSLINKLLNLKDISTQHITNRKSLIGNYCGDKFNLWTNKERMLDTGDKIKLYPFQLTKYPNGKLINKIEYTVKSKIDTDVDYLYFIDKQIIFRIKPIFKIILEDHVLEHKDFLLNCWEKSNENCIVYYHIELIDRDENGSFKLTNTVNNKHSINEYIYPNIFSDFRFEQYQPTTKLEKLLNAEKLTEEETDNLFNPKVSTEPPKEPQKSLISESDNSGSDSDSDSENEYIKVDNSCGATNDTFNLQFSYNKYYNFTDEKASIEQSIKSLYNTNEKFKKLIADYDTVRLLKPISKSYTNQRYFNFILTTKDKSIFSPQYHGYLNDTNEIISLTQIQNILV